MKTLSEIQNLAREEKELLAFFESGTEVLDCGANENVMRSWLDKEFLPVTLDNLKSCEKAISKNLEKKQKPFVPRPPAPPPPKEETQPEPEKHYLGEKNMTSEQLGRVRRGRGAFAPLPAEITRTDIRKSSAAQLRDWMEKYGSEQLTIRVNQGEKK